MSEHQSQGISDEQLWGTYHATRKNTEEIDRMSAQLVVLNNRVTAHDIKLADQGNRIDDCGDREDKNTTLIIGVQRSVDGIHDALIDERKGNLRSQDAIVPAVAHLDFWAVLGKWTQVMVAIAATGTAVGIMWAIWVYGVRNAIPH